MTIFLILPYNEIILYNTVPKKNGSAKNEWMMNLAYDTTCCIYGYYTNKQDRKLSMKKIINGIIKSIDRSAYSQIETSIKAHFLYLRNLS